MTGARLSPFGQTRRMSTDPLGLEIIRERGVDVEAILVPASANSRSRRRHGRTATPGHASTSIPGPALPELSTSGSPMPRSFIA